MTKHIVSIIVEKGYPTFVTQFLHDAIKCQVRSSSGRVRITYYSLKLLGVQFRPAEGLASLSLTQSPEGLQRCLFPRHVVTLRFVGASVALKKLRVFSAPNARFDGPIVRRSLKSGDTKNPLVSFFD